MLLDTPEATVLHAPWTETLALVKERGRCDAIVTDCPYSARTHEANDGTGGGGRSSRMKDPGKLNRPLNYACWSASDVDAFVEAWSPVVRGWFVSITDHTLAPVWAAALEAAGRYAFSPLACVQRGSRVRLLGDGPAQWSTWAVVARPRNGEWLRQWRLDRGESVVSLPGAYVAPTGFSEEKAVVGGKTVWLMSALVRDYSRKGDLVCDPCAGAGTTGVAARTLGRRFVGGDVLRKHAEMSAKAIGGAREQLRMWEGT